MSDKSLDNLVHWKPGKSGNPKGRPKGALSRKTVFKKFLAAGTGILDNDGIELNAYEVGWLQQIRKFMMGDKDAAKLISDYFEGKAQDNKKVTINETLASMTKEEKIKLLAGLLDGK